MLTHQLPSPIRGATHAQLTARRETPGSGIVLHYVFGSMDGGTFVRDSMLSEVGRFLTVHQAAQVREYAAANGAPITGGSQEYRWADLLAVMDAEEWWEK